jgi:hypothetical protein
VRSAIYRAATPPDRRRAHQALAAATDPQVDPDRRAWHRGQAVLGTDEEVAAELERSAGRARARGGFAAAATFLQRAAELTPTPAVRARRALDAAYHKHEAGASAAALELLEVEVRGPLDAPQHARRQLLQAQIAFNLTLGGTVPGMLLEAARTLAPLDPASSRLIYLQALDAANIIGGRGPGRGVLELAEAARDAPPPPGPPGPLDLLLDGLIAAYTHGYAAGVPALRQATMAFRGDEPRATPADDAHDIQWLWRGSRAALALFDDELGHLLASRSVQLTRNAGALATLPAALTTLSAILVAAGEFTRAEELAAEEAAITRAIGAVPLRYAWLMLAA